MIVSALAHFNPAQDYEDEVAAEADVGLVGVRLTDMYEKAQNIEFSSSSDEDFGIWKEWSLKTSH